MKPIGIGQVALSLMIWSCNPATNSSDPATTTAENTAMTTTNTIITNPTSDPESNSIADADSDDPSGN